MCAQAQTACDNVLDFLSGYAAEANVVGGDAGQPVEVTNVNNAGPGSYRDALSQGDRYITFSPSLAGQTILLTSDIIVSGNRITLDGRGAPGLKISKHATKFEGTDYVVAFMNYQDMDGTTDTDCLTFRGAPANGALKKFFVFKSNFDVATDGAIDVIWNDGGDVYGTISRCKFQNIDKTILMHSGTDAREGGTYYMSFDLNWFYRTGQRNPTGRDSVVHYYNNLIEGWGGLDNNGAGAYAGRDSKFFMENNIAIAARAGDPAWNGEPINTPKTKVFSPTWQETTAAIKSVGTWLRNDAYIVDQRVDEIIPPPYTYPLVEADAELEAFIRQRANAELLDDCDLPPDGDADGDGMPNGWESEQGLDPRTADASEDPDGDGASNFDEYLAGTDPGDAADVLRIRIRKMAGGHRISVPAKSNRVYTLQSKPAPFATETWTDLGDFADLPGAPNPDGDMNFDVVPAPAGPLHFYRVGVRLP